MKDKFFIYSMVYTIGSIGYGIIEVLFRGFTHWTMLITGGICFVALYRINIKLKGFFSKCAAGTAAITGIEFAAGLLVNKAFKMNVWDYSNLPFNLMGQISLVFSGLWFLLCIPVMPLCEFIRRGAKSSDLA